MLSQWTVFNDIFSVCLKYNVQNKSEYFKFIYFHVQIRHLYNTKILLLNMLYNNFIPILTEKSSFYLQSYVMK